MRGCDEKGNVHICLMDPLSLPIIFLIPRFVS